MAYWKPSWTGCSLVWFTRESPTSRRGGGWSPRDKPVAVNAVWTSSSVRRSCTPLEVLVVDAQRSSRVTPVNFAQFRLYRARSVRLHSAAFAAASPRLSADVVVAPPTAFHEEDEALHDSRPLWMPPSPPEFIADLELAKTFKEGNEQGAARTERERPVQACIVRFVQCVFFFCVGVTPDVQHHRHSCASSRRSSSCSLEQWLLTRCSAHAHFTMSISWPSVPVRAWTAASPCRRPRATRPAVAVTFDVPVCPPQLLDTDDAAVDVPADGDCLFHCLQAGRRCIVFFIEFVNASLKWKHDQNMISVDPPRPH